MNKPTYCIPIGCLLKEHLGCYECYKTKPSLLEFCDEAEVDIADIEAYEAEARRAYDSPLVTFPVIE